jgi:hypothetical protein
MGEQPNPWDLLQPQDAMSRHRGAKPCRRCELLARSACYPRGSFYPLSDGPSMQNHRITKPDFRLCSTCRSRSQAPLCLCTRRLISNQPEGTFGRLRYLLGGDRPSQTTRLTLSPPGSREEVRTTNAGWYFTVGSTEARASGSKPPTYPTQQP